MSLNKEQRQFYEENGYLYPLRVFSDNETAEFRRQFDAYTDQNKDHLSKLIPRERRAIYGLTHLSLPWVYQIVSHPSVLDAVEGAIGPNLLVWGSDWFVKFPGDAAFISWHRVSSNLAPRSSWKLLWWIVRWVKDECKCVPPLISFAPRKQTPPAGTGTPRPSMTSRFAAMTCSRFATKRARFSLISDD